MRTLKGRIDRLELKTGNICKIYRLVGGDLIHQGRTLSSIEASKILSDPETVHIERSYGKGPSED